MRERRNSTSSVTLSSNKTITSITSVERGIKSFLGFLPICLIPCPYFLFVESYNSNLHTPTNLIAMTSPRPDVTHLSGGPPVLPPTGPQTSRGRNPLRRDLVHRKDSIKEVLQPSLSDPENPPKYVVSLSYYLVTAYLILLFVCFFLSRLNNIRHSPSEPSLNMRSHSTSRSSSLTRNRPDLTVPTPKARVNSHYSPFMSSQPPMSSHNVHQDFVPIMSDKPSGLDLEDFMPVITLFIFKDRRISVSSLHALTHCSANSIPCR